MKVIRHSRIPFIVTLLTLVFLYTPLVIVAIASFNASKYGGDWTHFTWKWYIKLFHEPDIWNALVKTLVIAVISTAISTVLGTLSALALHRSTSKLKAIYYARTRPHAARRAGHSARHQPAAAVRHDFRGLQSHAGRHGHQT